MVVDFDGVWVVGAFALDVVVVVEWLGLTLTLTFDGS